MPRKTKAQVEAELLAQQEGTVADTPMAENPVPNDALIEGEMSPEVSDENNESSDTPEDVSPLESTPQVDMVSDSEPLKEESAISSVPLYSVVQEPQDPSDSPEERSLPPEASAATEESKPEEKVTKPRRRATAKRPETEAEKLQAQRRSEFFHTDFKELDRDLSPEQLQEWQAIYASYRSQSILTGEVTGVDTNTFTVKNPETGETERRTIRSLVIIDYRVKVIIPETEIWAAGEERPDHVTRSLVGAKIEYVILEVDRAGECAIASRKLAMQKQRRRFRNLYGGQTGARVPCRVLTAGPKRCLLECGGFDIPCTQRDLSYTAIADLREKYHPGQELEAVFKGFSPETGKPVISVKEVNPNPFDGAEIRHPVGCRRQAVISGKYAGGVFCRLPDDVTVLCLYSNLLGDNEFFPGDSVLIHITQYDYNRQLIYGRIISKW